MWGHWSIRSSKFASILGHKTSKGESVGQQSDLFLSTEHEFIQLGSRTCGKDIKHTISKEPTARYHKIDAGHWSKHRKRSPVSVSLGKLVDFSDATNARWRIVRRVANDCACDSRGEIRCVSCCTCIRGSHTCTSGARDPPSGDWTFPCDVCGSHNLGMDTPKKMIFQWKTVCKKCHTCVTAHRCTHSAWCKQFLRPIVYKVKIKVFLTPLLRMLEFIFCGLAHHDVVYIDHKVMKTVKHLYAQHYNRFREGNV